MPKKDQKLVLQREHEICRAQALVWEKDKEWYCQKQHWTQQLQKKQPQTIQEKKLDQEKKENIKGLDKNEVLAWIEEMKIQLLAQQYDGIEILGAQQLEALQEVEQAKQ